jgi:lipopolysaccharide transport system permease protein
MIDAEPAEARDLLQQAASWESVTVIQPRRRLGLSLRELWAYHELLYFFVWRDVKVRYKQSLVGVAWVVLQPLATMTLFALIFGHLVRVPTAGIPYPPFVLTGLVAWQFFAAILGHSGTSLTENKQIVTRVYFPRVLVPSATVIASLVDFAVASVVLACFLAGYGIVPPASVVALPLFLLLLVAAALGVALWLSALNVEYRDVQYALPFVTQFWFFATPVVYSTEIIPPHWRLVLGLNPMAGIVTGLRWSLFDDAIWAPGMVAVSAVMTVLILVSGYVFFRSTERTFADVV